MANTPRHPLVDLSKGHPFKGLTILVVLISLFIARPTLATCTLYFEQSCLAQELTTLAPQLSGKMTTKAKALATTIALELLLPSRFQSRIWPYRINHRVRAPIAKLFAEQRLAPIWNEVEAFIRKIQKKNPETLHKNCLSATPAIKGVVHLSICSAPQFALSIPKLMTQSSVTKTETIDLLQWIHRQQIEQAQLEGAQNTAHFIVLETATEDVERQILARIQMIEHHIGFGYSDIALRKLGQFTTHADTIIAALSHLELYQKWAVFLAMADKGNPSLTKSQGQQDLSQQVHALDDILLLEEHKIFLEALSKETLLTQLRFFRQTAQAAFYSFFNSSPSQDLVFAYHSQRWLETWDTVKNQDINTAFEEGLMMLYLEMRISSFMSHQKMGIKSGR